MKVTLSDVANHANVSISTVSRVLSGSPGISKLVCERVIESVQLLGYKKFNLDGPNTLREIVAIIPHIYITGGSRNYFYQTIYEGLREECDRCHIDLKCVYYKKSSDDVINFIKDNQPESLAIIGVDDEALFNFIKKQAKPVVLVNTDMPTLEFDTIVAANIDCGYVATKHLLDLGHKQILHITNLTRITVRNRATGYEYAMTRAGYTDNIKIINLSSYQPVFAYEEITRLLRENKWHYTAVFAGADTLAFGAIDALRHFGLNVPNQVSVIGCDNAPMGLQVSPKLTTIDIPVIQLGINAVKLLREKRQQLDRYTKKVAISGYLIERETTKALN